jgi:hypothetical protein
MAFQTLMVPKSAKWPRTRKSVTFQRERNPRKEATHLLTHSLTLSDQKRVSKCAIERRDAMLHLQLSLSSRSFFLQTLFSRCREHYWQKYKSAKNAAGLGLSQVNGSTQMGSKVTPTTMKFTCNQTFSTVTIFFAFWPDKNQSVCPFYQGGGILGKRRCERALAI